MAGADSEVCRLFGWWRIVSFQLEFEDTKQLLQPYGAEPHGHLVIESGRMISILTSGQRTNDEPAALFESMIAYSGTCRIEDEDKLIVKVDTAWHPAWVGSEQLRFFRLDCDILSIMTAWQAHPSYPARIARGVMTAERINSGAG